MIIAVDFDGTLSMSSYPDIGAPNLPLINLLKEKKEKGVKLILWSCRVGERLERAVKYCEAMGLNFDAVNDNIKEMKERYGTDCRKVYADVYIDDAAVKPEDFINRFKVNENPYGQVGVF